MLTSEIFKQFESDSMKFLFLDGDGKRNISIVWFEWKGNEELQILFKRKTSNSIEVSLMKPSCFLDDFRVDVTYLVYDIYTHLKKMLSLKELLTGVKIKLKKDYLIRDVDNFKDRCKPIFLSQKKPEILETLSKIPIPEHSSKLKYNPEINLYGKNGKLLLNYLSTLDIGHPIKRSYSKGRYGFAFTNGYTPKEVFNLSKKLQQLGFEVR